MSNLKKLRSRMAAIEGEMRALLDKAAVDGNARLDEEAEKSYKAFEAELADLDTAVKREEAIEARERARPALPELETERTATAPPETPRFGNLGEFAQAVVRASRPGGQVDRRLRPEIGAASGLSEGVQSDGGFLVQADMQAGLMRRLYGEMRVWNRATDIPVGPNSNGVKINAVNETTLATTRWGGIVGYWQAEAAAKNATAPKFRQIELNLKKLIGLCYATDELLQDATSLEAILTEGFTDYFRFKLDDAAINGTGAGQPLGILNGGCLIPVVKETGQGAATIVAENVEKMYSRLWAPGTANAVWFMNQDCWPQIFKLSHAVGTGGVPMFVPAGGLSQSPSGTLLGRPIIPVEQCATLGTIGDIILADMSEYITCSKGGIQQASSIHLKFNYDETTFRWVLRVDGQPAWNSALTPYKGTATQSPFVALATRA